MSEWTISAATILERFEGRLAAEGETDAYLSDLSAAFGRHCADIVFLKVSGTPGMTRESGQLVADVWVQEYLGAVTDAVHANGGSIETAQQMVRAGVTAFGRRLQELAAASGPGGVA